MSKYPPGITRGLSIQKEKEGAAPEKSASSFIHSIVSVLLQGYERNPLTQPSAASFSF